jgi:hypothetical protein
VDRTDFMGGWAHRYGAAKAARVDDEGLRGRHDEDHADGVGMGRLRTAASNAADD